MAQIRPFSDQTVPRIHYFLQTQSLPVNHGSRKSGRNKNLRFLNSSALPASNYGPNSFEYLLHIPVSSQVALGIKKYTYDDLST